MAACVGLIIRSPETRSPFHPCPREPLQQRIRRVRICCSAGETRDTIMKAEGMLIPNEAQLERTRKHLAANMPTRKLGNSGLDVSVIGFGSWVSFDYQLDVDAAATLIEAAYENGINFFDNAEVYAHGKSELIMGEVFKKLNIPRSDIVITTKVFHGYVKEPTKTARGLSRKHIVEGTRLSLARLQLDYVDVVFAHRPDPTVPMEEIVRGFNFVIDQGMAFYWGTSEWHPSQILEAWECATRLGMVGPICEQPHYNMLHRKRVEHDLVPLYDRYKLGLTTWSPLASGLLTGKYSNGTIPEGSRFSVPRYQSLKDGILTEENLKSINNLQPLADSVGCSSAQLALAWCIANKNVSTVLTGATKMKQLLENIEAVKLVSKFESNEISWEEVGDALSPSTSVMSRF